MSGKRRFGELEVGVEQLLADIARLSAAGGEGGPAAAAGSASLLPR